MKGISESFMVRPDFAHGRLNSSDCKNEIPGEMGTLDLWNRMILGGFSPGARRRGDTYEQT